MKKGNKVLIKATNEIAIIENVFAGEKGILIYARCGKDLKCLFPREVVELSDIGILDEHKELFSDFVLSAEDGEGRLYEVTIPTADIASYFECEQIHLTEETDYQSAGQFIFDNWLNDSTSHDIELKIKYIITTTKNRKRCQN